MVLNIRSYRLALVKDGENINVGIDSAEISPEARQNTGGPSNFIRDIIIEDIKSGSGFGAREMRIVRAKLLERIGRRVLI